jgi:enoyl-CoA hydratase/carnithine racemase
MIDAPMTDKLLYEQDGAVVTLTFNMPDTRNALTDHDLCEAIVRAAGRPGGCRPTCPCAAPS